MSDTKTGNRVKKRVAVTTPKSDTKPIRTLTVDDKISFRPLPADKEPFTDHPLPAGRPIRIGYRVVGKLGSIGEEGSIAYPAKEGWYELPFTRARYNQIATVEVWAIPYGHAALQSTGARGGEFGYGRIDFAIPPISPRPEIGVLNIRVLDSVVGFTVAEMNRNKHDTKIYQCRVLNEEAEDLTHRAARKKEEAGLSNPGAYAEALSLSAQAASKFKEALGIFYEVETTGALWDHKTRIAKVWGHVNRLGDSEDTYYYDIWSNLHFGYVGHAAGFSLLTLAVGSDVQNFIDHFRPDEPADKSSSAEGYNLYRRGRDVTIEDLLAIVARHPEWRYAARTAK